MKCTNPNCNFDIDGVCIEGKENGECTHLESSSEVRLITPDSISLDEDIDDDSITNEEVKKKIHGQLPLSIAEVQERVRSRKGKFIAFVGPVGVGKTTLISSIYDAFNKTHELPVLFGGSDTLYAFESLCHLARIPSRASKVETPRTSSSEGVQFYHLAVKNEQNLRQDLFLSDRAGESYEEVSGDISLGNDLIELSNADLVLFLADSEKLSVNSSRHTTRLQTNTLIKSMVEAVPELKLSRCCLLLTKFDLVLGTEAEQLCRDEAERIIKHVSEKTSCHIDILTIAARPATPEFEKLYGFNSLVSLMSVAERISKKTEPRNYHTERSFQNMELIYG